MAGSQLYSVAPGYQDRPVPGATAATTSGPSHMMFIVWVVILGIVLPAAILGGLNVGGFKFVFKGR